jgi:heterodisulfide reductase subunit A
VNPILCKGDGVCTTKCPTDAIELKHFTNAALCSQIDAAVTQQEILQQMDAAVEAQ